MRLKYKLVTAISLMVAIITIVSVTTFIRREYFGVGVSSKLQINGVTLNDETFTYDGEVHGLKVTGNLPDGVVVRYENNNQTEAGTYDVSAILTSPDNRYEEKTLNAKMNIIIGDGNFEFVLTADGNVVATKYLGTNKNAKLPTTVFFKNQLRNVVGISDEFNYNDLEYSVTNNAQYLGNDQNAYMVLVGVIDKGVTSLSVDSNCTSIAANAFAGCTALTSIELSDKITSIGLEAFKGCVNLKTLVVGDNLTTIGYDAFSGCPIETATVPANLISYISKANLNTITITSGAILDNAFLGSTALTNVTIEDEVSSIGDFAFEGCTNLNYFTDDIDNPTAYYLGNSNNHKLALVKVLNPNTHNFVIDNDTKFVLSNSFKDLQNLYSVTIGSNVKELRKDAFLNTYRLVEVIDLSSAQNKITYSFFATTSGLIAHLKNINTINSASKLLTVGEFIFLKLEDGNNSDYYLVDFIGDIGNTTTKSTVVLPNKADVDAELRRYYINDYAFYNYSNIKTITISDDVYQIPSHTAFAGCKFENVTMPTLGINVVPKETISRLVLTTGEEIPNDAYRLSTSLTYVEISDNIKKISTGAFYRCSNLSEIKIGNGIDHVAENTFDYSPIRIANVPAIVVPYLAMVNESKQALQTLIVNSGNAIPRLALKDCVNLSRIQITRDIEFIGDRAFEGCTSILENMVTVGNCQYIVDTADIVNPQNSLPVVLVGTSNKTITSVVVDTNCKIIYDGAFSGCTSLNTINLPAALVQVAESAFTGCPVKNAVIPAIAANNIPHELLEKVEVISGLSLEDYAFENSINLTEMILPSTIEAIGNYAFRRCTELVKLTLPENVVSIGHYAFADCTKLKGTVDGNTGESIFVIPTGVTLIEDHTFDNCSSLEHISLPNGLLEIQELAFNECSNLLSVTIPSSVTTMGKKVFAYNSSLTEAIINGGNAVNEKIVLPEDTFQNCVSLATVTFGNNVKEIGAGAFYNCEKLDNVNTNKVETIRKAAFHNCVGLVNLNLGVVVTIYEEAFSGCESLIEVRIPITTVTIGAQEVDPTRIDGTEVAVFNNCNSLVRVYLGALTERSVTSFDSSKQYYKATEHADLAEFEANVDYYVKDNSGNLILNEEAFDNTKVYYTVAIASGLEGFEDEVDYYVLSESTYVKVNKTITTLEPDKENNKLETIFGTTFYSCKNLYEVYNYSNLPIKLGSASYGYVAYYAKVVHDVNESTIIDELNNTFVFTRHADTDGVVKLFLTKYVGALTTTEITLPTYLNANNEVVPYIIGPNAFIESRLHTVTIPNEANVTEIRNSAFEENKNLTTITLSNTITRIGEFVFANCTSLNNVVIPDSVTYIGQETFLGCSSLANVTLSANMTELSNQLFQDCVALQTFTVPANIIKINNSVFAGCTNLEVLNLHDAITEIGSSAFSNCSSLINVVLPKDLVKLSGGLFNGCTNIEVIVLRSKLDEIESYAFYQTDKTKVKIYYIGDQQMFNAISYDVSNDEYKPNIVLAGVKWSDVAVDYTFENEEVPYVFKASGTLASSLSLEYYLSTEDESTASPDGVAISKAGSYYIWGVFSVVGTDIKFKTGIWATINRIEPTGFVFDDVTTSYNGENRMLTPTLPNNLTATYSVTYKANTNYDWKYVDTVLYTDEALNNISLVRAGIYEITIKFDENYKNYILDETMTVTLEIEKADYPYTIDDMHLFYKDTAIHAKADTVEHKADDETKAFRYDGLAHVLEIDPTHAGTFFVFGTTTDLSPNRQMFTGGNVVSVDYTTLHYSTKSDTSEFIEANYCRDAGRYAVIATIRSIDYKDVEFYEAFEILKQNYDVSNLLFESRNYPYEDNKEWVLEISGILPSGVVVSYTNNKITSADIDLTKAVNENKVVATFLCDTTNYFSIPTMEAYLRVYTNSDAFAGITFEDETFFYNTEAPVDHTIKAKNLPAGTSISYSVKKKDSSSETGYTAVSGTSFSEVGAYVYTARVTIGDVSMDYIAVLTITNDPLSNAVFEDKKFVYDGTPKTLEVSGNIPEINGNKAVIEYTIVSVNDPTENLTNVTSYSYTKAGVYEVTATITLQRPGGGDPFRSVITKTLTITRATFVMDDVIFDDEYFAYDGRAHSMSVKNMPQGLQAQYTNNEQVEIGEYYVTARFALDDEYKRNYVVPESMEAKLTILRALIKSVDNANPSTLEPDKDEHGVAIGGRYVYLRDAVEDAPTDGTLRKVWLIKTDIFVENVLDENGNPIQKTDEHGVPLFNEDDTPIYITQEVVRAVNDDSGYAFTVKRGSNVLIDLNGKTYTFKDIYSWSITIEKGAILTITNGGIDVSSGDVKSLIKNYGTLNLNNVRIVDTVLERVIEMLYGTLNIDDHNELSSNGELISIYYGTTEDDSNDAYAIRVNLNDHLFDVVNEQTIGTGTTKLSGNIAYGTEVVTANWQDRILIDFSILNLNNSVDKQLADKLTFTIRGTNVNDYDDANALLTEDYRIVRTAFGDALQFKINKTDVKANGMNFETLSSAISNINENSIEFELLSSTVRAGDVVVENNKNIAINLKNNTYTFTPNLVSISESATAEVKYAFDVNAGGTLVIKNGTIRIKTSDFEKLINNDGNVILKNVTIVIIEEETKKLNELVFNTGNSLILDGVTVDSTLNTSTTLKDLFGISAGILTVTGKTSLTSNDDILLFEAKHSQAHVGGFDIKFDAFIEYGALSGVFNLSKSNESIAGWKNTVLVDMTEFRLSDFENLKFKTTASDVTYTADEIKIKDNFKIVDEGNGVYKVHRAEVIARVDNRILYYETLKDAVDANLGKEINVEFNENINDIVIDDIVLRPGQTLIINLNNKTFHAIANHSQPIFIGIFVEDGATLIINGGDTGGAILSDDRTIAILIKSFGDVILNNATISNYSSEEITYTIEKLWIDDKEITSIENSTVLDYFKNYHEYIAETLDVNDVKVKFKLTSGSAFTSTGATFTEVAEDTYEATLSYENVRKINFVLNINSENGEEYNTHKYEFTFVPKLSIKSIAIGDIVVETLGTNSIAEYFASNFTYRYVTLGTDDVIFKLVLDDGIICTSDDIEITNVGNEYSFDVAFTNTTTRIVHVNVRKAGATLEEGNDYTFTFQSINTIEKLWIDDVEITQNGGMSLIDYFRIFNTYENANFINDSVKVRFKLTENSLYTTTLADVFSMVRENNEFVPDTFEGIVSFDSNNKTKEFSITVSNEAGSEKTFNFHFETKSTIKALTINNMGVSSVNNADLSGYFANNFVYRQNVSGTDEFVVRVVVPYGHTFNGDGFTSTMSGLDDVVPYSYDKTVTFGESDKERTITFEIDGNTYTFTFTHYSDDITIENIKFIDGEVVTNIEEIEGESTSDYFKTNRTYSYNKPFATELTFRFNVNNGAVFTAKDQDNNVIEFNEDNQYTFVYPADGHIRLTINVKMQGANDNTSVDYVFDFYNYSTNEKLTSLNLYRDALKNPLIYLRDSFDMDTLNPVYLPKETDKVYIDAIAEDERTIIEGAGLKNIDYTWNELTVKVYSEYVAKLNLEPRIITIRVLRAYNTLVAASYGNLTLNGNSGLVSYARESEILSVSYGEAEELGDGTPVKPATAFTAGVNVRLGDGFSGRIVGFISYGNYINDDKWYERTILDLRGADVDELHNTVKFIPTCLLTNLDVTGIKLLDTYLVVDIDDNGIYGVHQIETVVIPNSGHYLYDQKFNLDVNIDEYEIRLNSPTLQFNDEGRFIIKSGQVATLNLNNQNYGASGLSEYTLSNNYSAKKIGIIVEEGATLIIKDGTLNISEADYDTFIKSSGTLRLINATINVISSNDKHLESIIEINKGDLEISGDTNLESTSDIIKVNYLVQPIYKITFETNGGTKVEDRFIENGSKLIRPTDPTRDSLTNVGYHFVGWYTDSEFENEYDFDTVVSSESAKTLYAKWAENDSVRITIDEANGNVAHTVLIENGTKLTLPETPVNLGYTFIRWSTRSGEGTNEDPYVYTAFDFDTEITSDLGLFAEWEVNGTVNNDYQTVAIYSNESLYKTLTIKKGNVIGHPDISRDGFILDGWFENDTFETPFDFTAPINENKTIYAKWVEVGDVEVFKLETPEVVIEAGKVKWDVIENASKYEVYIDGEAHVATSNEYALNITTRGMHRIFVVAKGSLSNTRNYQDSDKSTILYYYIPGINVAFTSFTGILNGMIEYTGTKMYGDEEAFNANWKEMVIVDFGNTSGDKLADLLIKFTGLSTNNNDVHINFDDDYRLKLVTGEANVYEFAKTDAIVTYQNQDTTVTENYELITDAIIDLKANEKEVVILANATELRLGGSVLGTPKDSSTNYNVNIIIDLAGEVHTVINEYGELYGFTINAGSSLTFRNGTLRFKNTDFNTFIVNNGSLVFDNASVEVIEAKSIYVSYNTNGGNAIPNEIIEKGEKLVRPDDPTKVSTDRYSYTFAGWFTNSGLTTPFDFDTEVSNDLVLYAKWTETQISFDVTFDNQGHGNTPQSLIKVVELPNTLPVLVADGYTFRGWKYANEQTAEPGDAVTEDITIYAVWEEIIPVAEVVKDISISKVDAYLYNYDGTERVLDEDGNPVYATLEYNIYTNAVTKGYEVGGLVVDGLYSFVIGDTNVEEYSLNLTNLNPLHTVIYISLDGTTNNMTLYEDGHRFVLGDATNYAYSPVYLYVFATDDNGVIDTDYAIYAITPFATGINTDATIARIELEAKDKDDNDVAITYTFDRDTLNYVINLSYEVKTVTYKVYVLEDTFKFGDDSFVKSSYTDDVLGDIYVYEKTIDFASLYTTKKNVIYGFSPSLYVSHYTTENNVIIEGMESIEYILHPQVYNFELVRLAPADDKLITSLLIDDVNPGFDLVNEDTFNKNFADKSSVTLSFSIPVSANLSSENAFSVVNGKYVFNVTFGDNKKVSIVATIKSQKDLYEDGEGKTYTFNLYHASEDVTLDSIKLYNNTEAKNDEDNADYKLEYRKNKEFTFTNINNYSSSTTVKYTTDKLYVLVKLHSSVEELEYVTITDQLNNLVVGDNIVRIIVKSEYAVLSGDDTYTKLIEFNVIREDKYSPMQNVLIDALGGSVSIINGSKLEFVETTGIDEEVILVNVYYGTNTSNLTSVELHIEQADGTKTSRIIGTIAYGAYFTNNDESWFNNAKIDVANASVENLANMKIKIQGDLITTLSTDHFILSNNQQLEAHQGYWLVAAK